MVAGFDYTYGDKNIANMATLPKYAQGRFDIEVMPKQIFAGKKRLVLLKFVKLLEMARWN